MRTGAARSRRLRLAVVAVASVLCVARGAGAVSFDWVTVGDPGNACDVQPQGCFGSVDTPYRISRHEVTNAQYVEFLNAKAASGDLGLYSNHMAGPFGGITRSGEPGSYSYSAIPGRESQPVVYVSFFDTLRFVNWLHNGQGDGDTETGSYTLLGGTVAPSNWATASRSPSARIFLPSEDEWYKAAYYDALSASYHDFPFADGFGGVACEGPPGATSHSASCAFASDAPSGVGAYAGSPSPYGTFDQGGNIREWTEAASGASRVLRGGSWFSGGDALAAAIRQEASPLVTRIAGFRVAMIPEPGTGLLVAAGLLVLTRRRSVRSRPNARAELGVSRTRT